MYTPKKAYFYGTGRRKSSVARVRLFPGGTGEIKINNRTIDNYFGLETLKMVCRQPFEVTGTEGKFDVECTVTGGGFTKRQEIKDLLKSLEKTMPGVRERIFGAMQRYPLEGWEPDKTRRDYK